MISNADGRMARKKGEGEISGIVEVIGRHRDLTCSNVLMKRVDGNVSG